MIWSDKENKENKANTMSNQEAASQRNMKKQIKPR